MARKRARDRSELIEALDAGGRALSTAVVLYHGALAARRGMTATETKALDLLARLGPLTAGALGEQAGLAPASVTGLLDRLERKGFARRIRDPEDGRRVLVEVVPDMLAALAPDFDDLMRELHALYEEFTAEQLEAIAHFLKEAARRQSEATVRLVAGPVPPRKKVARRRID